MDKLGNQIFCQIDGMNADERDEIHVLETERIIDRAFSVINPVGNSYHEKPFEEALVVDFECHNIPFQQQPRFPIYYFY